jgi:acyl carrier protein
MTNDEIIETINMSLSEAFELDLNMMMPEADIYEDLGLDSLDMVDLVVVLENSFCIKIVEEETIREIRTLGQIHEFVQAKTRAAG